MIFYIKIIIFLGKTHPIYGFNNIITSYIKIMTLYVMTS